MQSKKWIVTALCILVLISFLVYRLFIPKSSMFTYEFSPSTSSISRTMAIAQIEALEYKIQPYEAEIISEPSPEWGIKVYFSEDVFDFLYFYASDNRVIYPFPNDNQEKSTIIINERELQWGIFGDYMIGNYVMDDGYGIVIQMKKELWAENKELIIKLIKSAKVY